MKIKRDWRCRLGFHDWRTVTRRYMVGPYPVRTQVCFRLGCPAVRAKA